MQSNKLLSVKNLITQVKNEQIDTVLLLFTDLYGRFLGKKIDADFFINTALKQGVSISKVIIHNNNVLDRIAEAALSDKDHVYGDFCLKPDLDTLRIASWLEKTVIVIGDLYDVTTQELVPESPRTILRRQYEKFIQSHYCPKGASELEYYLFKESYQTIVDNHYHPIKPAAHDLLCFDILQSSRLEPFHQQVRKHLKRTGIPVETSQSEVGMGQQELNIAYAPIFEMADRHVIYKECLKEVSDQMNFSVTFMAKPFIDQLGSSCHVHISLWQGDNNCFAGEERIDDLQYSLLLKWFLGGMMQHVPEFMVFYAPNINSYKRYQELTCAPLTVTWALDNRSAAFRIIGQGKNARIEFRVPGADCNPYLLYAAILASGLDGITHKTLPPNLERRNCALAENAVKLPKTLEESIENFANSAFARESFGIEVVEHYLKFFRSENLASQHAVTDWELKRYFEQI